MVRYGDVIADELRRMRTARLSRGFEARGPRHWGVLAKSAGALFIRSYERGERVHLAMLSRGYTGSMPPALGDGPASRAAVGRARPHCRSPHSRSACWDGPCDPLPTAADAAARPASAAETPSLQVSGLAYAYPDGHQALFGVDLTVPRGQRVALLGPNGAGKTTLVLHLNGILTAGAGSVTVGGLPVERAHLAEIRRRVGIVFQDPDDQLFMPTVREDVAFGPAAAGLRGAELEARVREALERVGMAEHADRAPHHLSFGQRRRVAVATVLAAVPRSSSWTSPPPTWIPPPAANSPISSAPWT